MSFPELLAGHVRRLRMVALLGLAGCPPAEKPDTDGSSVEKTVCENGPIPEGYELVLGFVTVPVGTPCPDPASLSSLETPDCCPVYNFAGPVCRLDNVMANQEAVSNGAGSTYFQDATAETENPVDVCVYEALFENTGACCGRPFLVDGSVQVAESSRSPQGKVRCLLSGRYWAQVALLEHASIASFARCSLELMKWGAPLHLLHATQRAGMDEVGHAQLSRALAERLLGERLDLGELKLGSSVALSASRAEFAEAVLREGAIGESLAVLDAAARLQNCTDRETEGLLEQILKDEADHAALAWAILKWLVEEDRELLPQLGQVMVEERAKGRPGEASPVPPGFGLIDSATQQKLFEEGWERVLLPAFAELSQGLTVA